MGNSNQELQKQESKPLKSGDEGKFIESLKSKKIKDCTHDEIKEVLRYVMIKIGLRAQNFPNDLEKLILVEHIQQEFGGHHLQEIKVAFDLAIGRKLEVEVNCYENFSCVYFTNIMLAYRDWSREMYEQYQNSINKPEVKQLEYVIDPRKEIEELLGLYVEDCKKGLLRLEYVMPSLYDKLIQHGFIEPIDDINSLDQKRNFVFNFIATKATIG